MTRGRRPEPGELKEAKGNPGKRPIVTAPTDVLPVIGGDAPAQLTDEAKAVWARVGDGLRSMGLARTTDDEALARYCMHVATFWRLTKELEAEGETYWTDSAHGKMMRINPKFRVRAVLELRLESLEGNFGLTPRARQEIMYRLSTEAAAAGNAAPRTEAPTPSAPASPLGLLGRAASEGLH